MGDAFRALYVGARTIIGAVALADLLYPKDRWASYLVWLLHHWRDLMNGVFEALPIKVAPNIRDIWALAFVVTAAAGLRPFFPNNNGGNSESEYFTESAAGDVFLAIGLTFVFMILFSFVQWLVASVIGWWTDPESVRMGLKLVAGIILMIIAFVFSRRPAFMIVGAAIALVAVNEALIAVYQPAASLVPPQ